MRKVIYYIPQQSFIFNGTIKENLLFGNTEATLDDAINACKLTGINKFIELLSNKYETNIGNEGVNLSGGQKQKLAIARGIIRNPKILLLDEITSDLDSESELQIMSILRNLSNKFTIVTIAHRISTVLSCSNIIVMDRGKIIDQGIHEELINRCNVYINLYKRQLNNIKTKS